MKPNRQLSATCQLDLKSIVKELQDFRKPLQQGSRINLVRGTSLLEVFADEAKFLREYDVKLSSVVPVLIQNLALPLEGPLGKAALLASYKMEETVTAPSYHNHHHALEVVLAAYILGMREKLPIYGVAELIIAAVAHDLGHNGRTNEFSYEREACSVDILKPLLEEAGLQPESMERIEKMILATDFKVGVPNARQAYKEMLLSNGQDLSVEQCLLLTEADVLFSCFSLNYNEILSKLLSEEREKCVSNLSMEERVKFLCSVQFLSRASSQLGLEERRKKLVGDLSKWRVNFFKKESQKVGVSQGV